MCAVQLNPSRPSDAIRAFAASKVWCHPRPSRGSPSSFSHSATGSRPWGVRRNSRWRSCGPSSFHAFCLVPPWPASSSAADRVVPRQPQRVCLVVAAGRLGAPHRRCPGALDVAQDPAQRRQRHPVRVAVAALGAGVCQPAAEEAPSPGHAGQFGQDDAGPGVQPQPRAVEALRERRIPLLVPAFPRRVRPPGKIPSAQPDVDPAVHGWRVEPLDVRTLPAPRGLILLERVHDRVPLPDPPVKRLAGRDIARERRRLDGLGVPRVGQPPELERLDLVAGRLPPVLASGQQEVQPHPERVGVIPVRVLCPVPHLRRREEGIHPLIRVPVRPDQKPLAVPLSVCPGPGPKISRVAVQLCRTVLPPREIVAVHPPARHVRHASRHRRAVRNGARRAGEQGRRQERRCRPVPAGSMPMPGRSASARCLTCGDPPPGCHRRP